MDKKSMLKVFISQIKDRNLLTKFIASIFGYTDFHDYNYLFRMIDNDYEVIIDIYDNVSDNRFNRYIFSFLDCDYSFKVVEEANVFVNYICVININDGLNKLEKLAYLFKIDNNKMIEYSKTFLDDVFVEILIDIIK